MAERNGTTVRQHHHCFSVKYATEKRRSIAQMSAKSFHRNPIDLGSRLKFLMEFSWMKSRRFCPFGGPQPRVLMHYVFNLSHFVARSDQRPYSTMNNPSTSTRELFICCLRWASLQRVKLSRCGDDLYSQEVQHPHFQHAVTCETLSSLSFSLFLSLSVSSFPFLSLFLSFSLFLFVSPSSSLYMIFLELN